MLQLQDIELHFNGRALFSGVDLRLPAGARVALIGNNGTGKSSLLRMLAGQAAPSAGQIHWRDGASVAYVPQHVLDGSARSGGEQMRHALARALDAAPDVLLLDEPSNHLDRSARRSLLARLRQYHGTLVIASHDTALIEALCGTLWHIHNQRIEVFQGRYHDHQLELQRRRDALDRTVRDLDRAQSQAHDALMREQERAASSRKRGAVKVEQRKWGTVRSATKLERGNTTAGQKRQQIRDVQEDIAERRRQLQRAEVIAPRFQLPAGWRREGVVVQVTDGACGYHAPLVVQQLQVRLEVGDCLLVTGDNGSGKSTFARALQGATDVQREGDWLLPAKEQVALIDQHYDALPSALTPVQAMAACQPQWTPSECRLHLADFLFRGEAPAQTTIGQLSGGERARLAMALMAAHPPTLLILDEPTNNLDMSLRAHLLQVLHAYPGTLVVISHDEGFIQSLQPTQQLDLPAGNGAGAR
ncbi:TPA: ABC-F family ATP-binding cassette domain-containing protein [Stenotrophomonas maltophilia]|nr:ABC-F family ATP-binding cassette domain-containing protein [Stenotrophomonas maltophilia]